MSTSQTPDKTPRATEESLENALELKDVQGLSQGQIVRARFVRHKGAMGALIVLTLTILLAVTSIGVGAWTGWWKYTPGQIGTVVNGGAPTMTLPTWLGGSGFAIGDHPFGQDEAGRDNFARVMRGTQTSLVVMAIVGIVATVIGILVGALSGYFRGRVDAWLMRFTDLMITIPIIVIGAILGNFSFGGGPLVLGFFLGLVSWTGLARLVRGDFLSLREREFVDAAKVAGASHKRIIFKHMLPNAMGVIIVNTTLLMSSAILLETSLSYLGFGIRSPDVSLGKLISDYQEAFSTRPWLFWWPGLFIVVIALCINFIGDGLRDAFDPRQKRIPSQRAMDRAAASAARTSGEGVTVPPQNDGRNAGLGAGS